MINVDERFLSALCHLALKDFCSYIDISGTPVMCSYETYKKIAEDEFNKFTLNEEEFNLISNYMVEIYKNAL